MEDLWAEEFKEVIKDGQPCNHNGCLNHIKYPCEGCGRYAGKGSISLPKKLLDNCKKYKNEEKRINES